VVVGSNDYIHIRRRRNIYVCIHIIYIYTSITYGRYVVYTCIYIPIGTSNAVNTRIYVYDNNNIYKYNIIYSGAGEYCSWQRVITPADTIIRTSLGALLSGHVYPVRIIYVIIHTHTRYKCTQNTVRLCVCILYTRMRCMYFFFLLNNFSTHLFSKK